ncbi:regulation of thyroid hormone proteinration [Branchiostoma belcheri]|nr:regulation of thyroid hormone proteinration [Branchiostoma belcheri]
MIHQRLMYCVQVFFAIVVGGIIITLVCTPRLAVSGCVDRSLRKWIPYSHVRLSYGTYAGHARRSYSYTRVVNPQTALCAYGQDWDVASVSTVTAYKARSAAHIPAQISVKIGLKSFNVTMTVGHHHGQPNTHTFKARTYPGCEGEFNGALGRRTVGVCARHVRGTAYGEDMSVPGNQSSGRLQYSERYGLDLREFSSDLHTSHLAGVPYPVIKVAEDMALTKLAEYSTTGHYTMMLMWLSLSLWVLTGLLFSLVRRYGAYCLLLTGITLLLAVVPVASTRLGPAHVIHFPNATLRFSLGWCFWTALVTGCMCTSSGLVFSIVELTKHSRDLESSPNQEEVKVGLGSSGVTNLAFETDEQSAGNTNQTTSMNKSGLISTEEKPPHRTVDRKQPPTFLAGSEQAPGSQKVWSSGTDRSSQGFQECGHSGMWVRDMPVDIPFLWTKCLYHS